MRASWSKSAKSKWTSHSTWRKRERGEISNLSCINLLGSQFSWLPCVSSDMLLKDKCICVLLLTDGALVEHPHRGLGPVHAHVSLQVALRGEGSSTNSAFERSFAGVRAIVHLESRFARKYSVADDTLVRIGQLVLNVVDQLLELGCFTGFADLNERLPGVVIAARAREKIGVNVGVFCRVEAAGKAQR